MFTLDASYLIVGGLGGIGRSISQFMVNKGVKNLILLSRSATSKLNAMPLIKEIKSRGCRVIVESCDIADKSSLARAIEQLSRTMPPVKGVVQGAMVLHVPRPSVF